MAVRYSDGAKAFMFFVALSLVAGVVGLYWAVNGSLTISYFKALPRHPEEIKVNENELVLELNDMRPGKEIIVRKSEKKGEWIIPMKSQRN